jgi:hypothetical protein
MTAFMPDAQTLFSDVQGTLTGKPAPSAACVAVAYIHFTAHFLLVLLTWRG